MSRAAQWDYDNGVTHRTVGEGGFRGGGKRYVEIECPFCKAVSTCFVWSLAGGGKLCPCGAKLWTSKAYKKLAKEATK